MTNPKTLFSSNLNEEYPLLYYHEFHIYLISLLNFDTMSLAGNVLFVISLTLIKTTVFSYRYKIYFLCILYCTCPNEID